MSNPLPSLEFYLSAWNLSSPLELAQTATSQIYQVKQGNSLAVLKLLTELGKRYESSSAQVLKVFNGQGAVQVLRSDDSALLLEQVDREKLSSLVYQGRDAEAAHIICDVLKKIHSYQGPCPTVHDLKTQFRSLFQRGRKENSQSLFYKAAKVAEDLVVTETNKKLLHGDIHHTNILKSSTRGWLAIDPQSFFGEATYDVSNSFFNPDDRPEIVETKERLETLAQIFSERLQVNKKRVLQFAFAHGALSSSWQLDEGKRDDRRRRITELIGQVLAI